MARICLIWVLFSLFVVCFLPFLSQKVVFSPAKRNKFVYKTLQVMWFDIPLRLAVPLYSPEDTAWKSFKQRQILWRLTLESHWGRRIACVARARKGKKGNRASPVPVSPSPFERLPRKLGLLREWRLTIREIKWNSTYIETSVRAECPYYMIELEIIWILDSFCPLPFNSQSD